MLVRTCCLAEEGVEADDELVLVVGVVAELEIGGGGSSSSAAAALAAAQQPGGLGQRAPGAFPVRPDVGHQLLRSSSSLVRKTSALRRRSPATGPAACCFSTRGCPAVGAARQPSQVRRPPASHTRGDGPASSSHDGRPAELPCLSLLREGEREPVMRRIGRRQAC